MNSMVGTSNHGEFSGSVVALFSPEEVSVELGAFLCWTPHRYALSIEQNEFPLNLVLRTKDELEGVLVGDLATSIVDNYFGGGYGQIVRGPREGRLSEIAGVEEACSSPGNRMIDLAVRTPFLRAMADPGELGSDLLNELARVQREGNDDRAIKRLLRYCERTLQRTDEALSADQAARAWFASLAGSLRGSGGSTGPAHLRDARRMVRALLEPSVVWVSGDWTDNLAEIVIAAVGRLSAGTGSEDRR